ncbi:MAG: ThiF family adenylyltransferase, partial [bacterium]
MDKASLLKRIDAAAELKAAPSGKEYRGISRSAVEAISSATGVGLREVEIAALEGGIVPLRYQRNVGSLGIEGQLKLRLARVAVVGAGGLGGTIIELLARVGIGALTVIDGDTFTEDNLNRQLLCTEEWVGRSKVEAARQRVSQVNSAVEVDV